MIYGIIKIIFDNWQEIVITLGIIAGSFLLGVAALFPSTVSYLVMQYPTVILALTCLAVGLVLVAWVHRLIMWLPSFIRGVSALLSARSIHGEFATANSAFQALLQPEALYFNHFKLDHWMKRYSDLHEKARVLTKIRRGSISRFKQPMDMFLGYYANGEGIRAKHNLEFISAELTACSALFDDIEGRSLDEQQRVAIVTAEDNNLVIAGAGTGKTSTIVGRVKYLVERCHADPAQILVLSFTKKSADELRSRMDCACNISTFHKLGKDIYVARKQEKTWVYDEHDLKNDLRDIWKEALSDKGFLFNFASFFFYHSKPFRSSTSATSVEEKVMMNKECHHARVPLMTLNHKRLRSQEEVRIYNFLLLHQVKFDYEVPYEQKTGSMQYAQYMPDFTIHQNGKRYYLEHFGVDRKGNTAPGIDPATYKQRMNWKRTLHKKNGTELIETYSYEIGSPQYADILHEKLSARGIVLRLMSAEDLVSAAAKEPKVMEDFLKLVGEFLSLYKANCVSIIDLYEKAGNEEDKNDVARGTTFLKVFEKMLDGYEKMLTRKQKIDFGDMILKAVDAVKKDKYRPSFSHIIVDEFQDMSLGRYQLLKAIRDANPGCIMYGVGDDWQSIYRFTGSDISLLCQFEKHFGVTAISKIETTYRFANPLLELGSEFVMANPHQIKKQLVSQDAEKSTEIFFHYYMADETKHGSIHDTHDTEELPQTTGDAVLEALDSIAQSNHRQVLVLGRYNFDIGLLASPWLSIETTEDANIIRSKKHPDLEIRFLTVHSAKGLEADTVILVNCKSGLNGFPSEIADDPLLTMMMAEPDKMKYGEERRLFYVAMTRARKALHLIIDKTSPSPFLNEIIKDEMAQQDSCPLCHIGVKVLRTSLRSPQFWGCSNFPYGCPWTQNIPSVADLCARGNNNDW